MPAVPRGVRTACVTGVDKTDADRKRHRTLPGHASSQGAPAGAATAVLQLVMALLQPLCTAHAVREAKSAKRSRSVLPRGIRMSHQVTTLFRNSVYGTFQAAGGSVGKEDCCWKQHSRLSTAAKLGYND